MKPEGRLIPLRKRVKPHRPPSTGPWYRHPWPWFLVAITGGAVLASLWTLAIAFENRDAVVRDDWYAEGKTINRRLEKEQRARALGVRAELVFDARRRVIEAELFAPGIDKLDAVDLALSHVTLASRDRVIELVKRPGGRYEAPLEGDLAGRWHVWLEPRPPEGHSGPLYAWRLASRLRLPATNPILLGDAGDGV